MPHRRGDRPWALAIVGGAQFGALERAVGFADRLELSFAIRVGGNIGVEALGQAAVGVLDVIARGGLIDFHGAVIIYAVHGRSFVSADPHWADRAARPRRLCWPKILFTLSLQRGVAVCSLPYAN